MRGILPLHKILKERSRQCIREGLYRTGVAPAFPLLGHGTRHWVHRGWLFTSRCLRLCL